MAQGLMTMQLSVTPIRTDLYGNQSVKAEVTAVDGKPSGSYTIDSGSITFSSINIYTSNPTYWRVTDPSDSGSIYAQTETMTRQTSAEQVTLSFGASIGTGIMSYSSGSMIGLHFYGFGQAKAINLRTSTVTIKIWYSYDETQGMTASTGLLSSSNVTIGDTVTLSITGTDAWRCSHVVEWKIGSQSTTHTIAVSEYSDPSDQFTIPTAWCNSIINSSKGSATCTLRTMFGSKQIGSTQSIPFTVNVPDNANTKPAVSSMTAQVVNTNTTVAAWGICLQGFSTVTLTCSASAKYNATIQSYTFSGPGGFSVTTSSSSTSVTALPSGTAGQDGYYTVTYSVTAKDSRGFTSTAGTVTVNVYPYSPPAIGSVSAYRTDAGGTVKETGTYITAQGAFSYSPVGKDSEDHDRNTASMSISYKRTKDDSWTSGVGSATSGQQYTFGGGNIDTAETYSVRFEVTDTLGRTTYKEIALGTVGYCMFFKRGGLGVGIGTQTTLGNGVAGFEVSADWQMLWGTERIPGVIYSDRQPDANNYNLRTGLIWLQPVS